jgi:hypothetical protein
MTDTNALIDRLIRIKDGLTHRADRDAINEACAAFTDGSFYKESDIDAMQAQIAALEAHIARIEGRLTERRKMHRTDVLLARTADVRAQIAGVRPADAMAVSDLEEAYTDCVTRLDDATAQIAALEAQIATLTKERDAARSVRVKPLVWGETPNNKMYVADHGAGNYIVIHDFDGWRWLLVNGQEMAGAQDHPVPEKEAAKAAAQADYEARILAALEKPE